MSITVIKAALKDVDQLALLFDAYRVWYRKEADLGSATAFITDRITHADSVIYALELDGELLGFTQLYPLFSSTRMKKMWLLNDLYIHEEHRGRGYSKLLIDKAKDLCKQTGACGVLLETEKSNEIGNKLYPSTGFILEDNNFYFWTNQGS